MPELKTELSKVKVQQHILNPNRTDTKNMKKKNSN